MGLDGPGGTWFHCRGTIEVVQEYAQDGQGTVRDSRLRWGCLPLASCVSGCAAGLWQCNEQISLPYACLVLLIALQKGQQGSLQQWCAGFRVQDLGFTAQGGPASFAHLIPLHNAGQ